MAMMWSGSALHFIAMWAIMMAAMMLPSLLPMLWRYRMALCCRYRPGDTAPPPAILMVLAASSYFAVWAATGALIFPLGATLTRLLMTSSALASLVPTATSTVLLVAGGLQLTRWKGRQLARCADMPPEDCILRAGPRNALRHGLRLGIRCAICCAPLTAMLLVLGVMDLRWMALMTLATSLERLPRAGGRSARVIGAATILTAICARVST
jgi:predicted metal-binding membrane protein